jgi:hypothetical protein
VGATGGGTGGAGGSGAATGAGGAGGAGAVSPAGGTGALDGAGGTGDGGEPDAGGTDADVVDGGGAGALLAEGVGTVADGPVGKLADDGFALEVGGGGLDCAFNTNGAKKTPAKPMADRNTP